MDLDHGAEDVRKGPHVHVGGNTAPSRPPNARLQRTRSASPPSPLSRKPLGGLKRRRLREQCC